MENKRRLRHELIQAINDGLEAASAAKFLIPVIQRRKNILIETLCNSSLDYQKIDNSFYFALHLELKLLTEMQNDIESAILRGEESSEKLIDLQNPEPRDTENFRM